tara:strand:- start:568 stop:1092 length:525 start_codon:yes stop_codon:yes gene_type:complete
MISRGQTVGVMGSGTDEWEEFATPLGAWIAKQGYNLLTGAGNGVMRSVSKAFVEQEDRTGVSIGVVKTDPCDERMFVPAKGYPNPYVEIPIYTPLAGYSDDAPNAINRNYINILSSDVVVALAGGKGTINEIELCENFKKPLIIFCPNDYFKDLPYTQTDSFDEVKDFISKTLT